MVFLQNPKFFFSLFTPHHKIVTLWYHIGCQSVHPSIVIHVRPSAHLYFYFQLITLVNVNAFSPNLLYALSVCNASVFYFQDNNVSKSQWIFTKSDMCIDIVAICSGIAHGQILSVFDSYLPVT